MNKNGVIAVVVVVVAIVLVGLWAMRSGQQGGRSGPDCSAPPGTPQSVNATVEKDIVTITWTPPAGERVATYLIEATTTRGVNPTTFVAPGSATRFQRQAPAAVYYVHVFARNACGTSAPSPELVVTVQ